MKSNSYNKVFEFILEKLNNNQTCILLCVVDSKGSSPGRQGFKMAIADDDSFCGTIGGGIMEFKLVEKAKSLLQQSSSTVFLQEQFHDKEKSKNQSGMICSGAQTIAFVPLSAKDNSVITSIISQKFSTIIITIDGINCNDRTVKGFEFIDEIQWNYSESVQQKSVIHIIGGGHCSLALSQLMQILNFEVHVYDDRENLSTLNENKYAHNIHIVNYEQFHEHFHANENDYIVIMTVGYRTDKIILKQIIHHSYKYLGLLGSAKKIETLFKELKEEGFDDVDIKKVHAPVGVQIQSKTTQEIAVSIAAEIIAVKNTTT